MRTAYCVLRIGALSGASFGAYCVLRIAYCVFEARSQANFEVHCVLRTADTPTALTYLQLSLTNCILIRSWGSEYTVVQYGAYTVVTTSPTTQSTSLRYLRDNN